MCVVCVCVAADGVGSLGAEQNHLSVPVTDHEAWATAMNNLGIMPVGISGQQLVSGAVTSNVKWNMCIFLSSHILHLPPSSHSHEF